MKKTTMLIILICVFLIVGVLLALSYFRILPHTSYLASDFELIEAKSNLDADNDGVDDYTDILLGARKDAENKPTYRSAYYDGGYPPKDEGVCTDVIWRAFDNAGYDLKQLVDQDIHENMNEYGRVNGVPDPNIDFRRVPNLLVYFQRNALQLTKNIKDIKEWQPGDIVVFSDSHIAIVSDKRNADGIPWIIHNADQPVREEDAMERWAQKGVTGHFRWHP